MLDRPLPSLVEAEKSLMGCVMVHPECLEQVMAGLELEWLYNPECHKLYRVYKKCFTERIGIDTVSLNEEAVKLGLNIPSEIISQIMSNACMVSQIKYNIGLIKDTYKRRQNIKFATELITASYDPLEKPEAVIQNSLDLLLGNNKGYCLTIESEIDRIIDDIQSQKQDKIIDTPFWQLNARLSMRKQYLYTIGGETSHGKTAFLINLIGYWVKKGLKVMLASYETVNSNVPRLIATEYGISTKKVFNPTSLSEAEKDKYLLSASDFLTFNDNLILLDNPTTAQILAQIRIYKPDIVLLDYFQLYYMKNSEKRNNSETDAMTIGRSVAQLRDIAQRENVCFIQTSQLTRPKEQKLTVTAPKYSLYRLKESGYIEQFSSAVLIVWWENDEGSGDNTHYSVYINKNTFGRKGKVELTIDPPTQKISNAHISDRTDNQESLL